MINGKYMKPCPFCGESDLSAWFAAQVICNSCGMSSGWSLASGTHLTIDKWNQRPSLWKPISEAPKDGTPILACDINHYNPRTIVWATYKLHLGKYEWRDAEVGGNKVFVTHYQDIPDPPKEEEIENDN